MASGIPTEIASLPNHSFEKKTPNQESLGETVSSATPGPRRVRNPFVTAFFSHEFQVVFPKNEGAFLKGGNSLQSVAPPSHYPSGYTRV